MRLAAIDIGSNAARLLVKDVVLALDNKPMFLKISLVRVPLRLGFDVFELGEISEAKTKYLITTLVAYKNLIEVYEVNHYKACATSAMRDAKNSAAILERVEKETGIKIDIISGDEEANFIFETNSSALINDNSSLLYIDVGGGSTELTFIAKGKIVFKQSFNIGTIRLLKNQITKNEWNEMKEFLKEKISSQNLVSIIGTGGNINKIFSLSKQKDNSPLSLKILKDYYDEFSSLSVWQRMVKYNLREDRADVIVPALEIFINIMKTINAKKIYVPKIGLADGLIEALYREGLSF